MKYIFIDTNIFLHFQDFEKINWLKETSSEKCKLIISPIVIDELDKAKVGNTPKSKRAKKTLHRFEQMIENCNEEIKENIYLEVLYNKPKTEFYNEYELNFDEQDHRLLASMITFRIKRKVTDILICTDDIGPRLRAKQYDFESIKLNEKYRLPSQDSEIEKKIKKLELENEQLKNRIPKLKLEFKNNKEFIKIKKGEEFNPSFENFKNSEIEKIKIKHPHINPQDYVTKNTNAFLNSFFSLNAQQIETYNKELNEYYENYENYLIEEFEYVKKSKLSFDLIFCLENFGNTPAKDIDIHLHFPDGFELIETSESPELSPKPKVPYKPKNSVDFKSNFHPGQLVSPIINQNSMTNFIDSPTIKKTNSYDVNFHKTNLKHGYVEKLNSLTIIYEKYELIKNFQIEYVLSAENIPTTIQGKLNVIFN